VITLIQYILYTQAYDHNKTNDSMNQIIFSFEQSSSKSLEGLSKTAYQWQITWLTMFSVITFIQYTLYARTYMITIKQIIAFTNLPFLLNNHYHQRYRLKLTYSYNKIWQIPLCVITLIINTVYTLRQNKWSQ
jgi:hypothetical protein